MYGSHKPTYFSRHKFLKLVVRRTIKHDKKHPDQKMTLVELTLMIFINIL